MSQSAPARKTQGRLVCVCTCPFGALRTRRDVTPTRRDHAPFLQIKTKSRGGRCCWRKKCGPGAACGRWRTGGSASTGTAASRASSCVCPGRSTCPKTSGAARTSDAGKFKFLLFFRSGQNFEFLFSEAPGRSTWRTCCGGSGWTPPSAPPPSASPPHSRRNPSTPPQSRRLFFDQSILNQQTFASFY